MDKQAQLVAALRDEPAPVEKSKESYLRWVTELRCKVRDIAKSNGGGRASHADERNIDAVTFLSLYGALTNTRPPLMVQGHASVVKGFSKLRSVAKAEMCFTRQLAARPSDEANLAEIIDYQQQALVPVQLFTSATVQAYLEEIEASNTCFCNSFCS